MERPLNLLLLPASILVLGLVAGLWLATASLALEQQSRALLREQRTVRFAWQGAPQPTQLLVVQCRADGVALTTPGGGPKHFFPLSELAREVVMVKALQDRVAGRVAQGAGRRAQWQALGKLLPREPRLRDSLSLALRRVEHRGGQGREPWAPLLLVYPEGLQSYDLAAFLVDAATLWPVVAEPMLPGWRVEEGA